MKMFLKVYYRKGKENAGEPRPSFLIAGALDTRGLVRSMGNVAVGVTRCLMRALHMRSSSSH